MFVDNGPVCLAVAYKPWLQQTPVQYTTSVQMSSFITVDFITGTYFLINFYDLQVDLVRSG